MDILKNYFFLISLSITLFFFQALLYQSSRLPKLDVSRQQTTINIDDKIIKTLDFGLHRTISSLLWAETLLLSDINHFKEQNLNNWMFLRLKTITALDPYFYKAYVDGAVYLSIVKDDELGAKFIYDRGLKYYPDDFFLNLNAAFHYYYELDESVESAKLLQTIVDNKKEQTPEFVVRFLARMRASNQNPQNAFDLIYQLAQSTPPNSFARKRYNKNLYALKAQIDLDCLNKDQGGHCSRLDFEGYPYLESKEGWIAQKKWNQFGSKKKKVKKKSSPD